MMMMIRIWAIEKPVNPNSPVFKFEQTPISELRASMENVGTTPLELGLISHSCYMNIYTYDTGPPFECLTLNNGTPFICLLLKERLSVNINQNRLFVAQVQNSNFAHF